MHTKVMLPIQTVLSLNGDLPLLFSQVLWDGGTVTIRLPFDSMCYGLWHCWKGWPHRRDKNWSWE